MSGPAAERGVRRREEPGGSDGDPDTPKKSRAHLIKTGVEAPPDGGKKEITNGGHVNRKRTLYLERVTSDSGPGLAAEVLANLFSAVRSTKEGRDPAAHGFVGLVRDCGGCLEDREVMGANCVRSDVLADLLPEKLLVRLVDLDDLFDAALDVAGKERLDQLYARHLRGLLAQKILGR